MVGCRTYLNSHRKGVAFKNAKWIAKGREVLTTLLHMHLVEKIFQVHDAEKKLALLVGNLVLNDKQQKNVALQTGMEMTIVDDLPPIILPPASLATQLLGQW